MNNRLKSRNVHSEIVYSLNPTNSVCSINEHSHLIIELTDLDCGLFSQIRHSGLHQGPVGSQSLRLPGDNSWLRCRPSGSFCPRNTHSVRWPNPCRHIRCDKNQKGLQTGSFTLAEHQGFYPSQRNFRWRGQATNRALIARSYRITGVMRLMDISTCYLAQHTFRVETIDHNGRGRFNGPGNLNHLPMEDLSYALL